MPDDHLQADTASSLKLKLIPSKQLVRANCALLLGSAFRAQTKSADDHAIFTLQMLYNLGVKLINEGKIQNLDPKALYFRKKNNQEIPRLDIGELSTNSFLLVSRNAAGIRDCLMKIYDELLQWQSKDGSIKNPLQAMFILFVSLDHLPVINIKHATKIFNEQLVDIKNATNEIVLPNGSEFTSSDVCFHLLNLYLFFRDARFLDREITSDKKAMANFKNEFNLDATLDSLSMTDYFCDVSEKSIWHYRIQNLTWNNYRKHVPEKGAAY